VGGSHLSHRLHEVRPGEGEWSSLLLVCWTLALEQLKLARAPPGDETPQAIANHRETNLGRAFATQVRCVRRRKRNCSGSGPAWQLPLGPDEMAGVAVRMAFQATLVLRLGLPKLASGRKLRHDLAWPKPRGFNVGDGFLGYAKLFVARLENRGPLACTSVVSTCSSRTGADTSPTLPSSEG